MHVSNNDCIVLGQHELKVCTSPIRECIESYNTTLSYKLIIRAHDSNQSKQIQKVYEQIIVLIFLKFIYNTRFTIV